MEFNYKKLYVLDLKAVFNIDTSNQQVDFNLNQLLFDIKTLLSVDKENIIKYIDCLKNVKSKFDFIYGHIYKIEDLKLQFTKKVEMKKKIVKYQDFIRNNPDSKNMEFENRVYLRFKFNIFELNSLDNGFLVLSNLKNIINEFLVFLKVKSKQILDKIYHPEKIQFDAEILILFIQGLVNIGISKNQYGKDISSSKLIKILMKTFYLPKPNSKNSYTEQTLIKKLAEDYKLKKNRDSLNEFKEKVQKFRNEIFETLYLRAFIRRLKK